MSGKFEEEKSESVDLAAVVPSERIETELVKEGDEADESSSGVAVQHCRVCGIQACC